jgi:hypothetical protein
MKCKCGRTMKWTLSGNFTQRPDRRRYHCPKCMRGRRDCECPMMNEIFVQALDALKMPKRVKESQVHRSQQKGNEIE